MTASSTDTRADRAPDYELDAQASADFIRDIVVQDGVTGKHAGRVVTRFPPEPNGYLHIGHAKSICLNFGIAREFAGVCHLRMDDTNPTGESLEFVEAIQRDVRWLGFDWADKMFFASDYFERLYEFAEELIRSGKAYVCSLSDEEIRAHRGTITEAGRPSPYRDRSVEENLDLFRRMRAGEFADGAHVLRARIDMASANMKMRDPLMYRIRHVGHYRTGDRWCIYPLYDFTHCLSDALEGITHSICTLEFENNRELYDWFLDNLSAPCHPQQIEFARLNLTYTVMSKRRLLELVREHHVSGWDDPRMPTIAGLRRRGVTPASIRLFAEKIGVAKNNSTVDVALLEHCIREDLNYTAPRVMAVLEPLKLVIDNYPDGQTEQLAAPFFPLDVGKPGERPLTFARELWIERSDFMAEPVAGFHRLAPGREVRLRHAYLVRCTRFERNAAGDVVEVGCTYDPASLGQQPTDRKVKGTIHWVGAVAAREIEVRLYDRLFRSEAPGASGADFKEDLNPDSLRILRAQAEPCIAAAQPATHFQLERQGFFFRDPVDHTQARPVYNRVVPLKDSWAKATARAAAGVQVPAAPASRKVTSVQGPAPSKGELGEEARELVARHGIGEEEARVLADDADLRGLFVAAVGVHAHARAIAALLVNEVRALVKEQGGKVPFEGAGIAELVRLVDEGVISGTAARTVLGYMARGEGMPRGIVERHELSQLGAVELERVVRSVLDDAPDLVQRYRAGNANLMGVLVGHVMRRTGGKADAKAARELLNGLLDA